MPSAVTLLMALNVVTAQPLPFERKGPYVITTDVFVNDRGPFRFLLDTGAQTCVVSEELAAKLGLKVQSRLEIVTIAGERTLAASTLDRLELGGVSVEFVETVIGGLETVRTIDRRIDGVLGQNFLRAVDYLVEFKRSELILNILPENLRGQPVPFFLANDRPVIAAEIEGRLRHLVLDSGASAVILFAVRPPNVAALLRTTAGHTTASLSQRVVRIGSKLRLLPVAEIARSGSELTVDGLFPLSAFASVYVSNRKRFVMLEPGHAISAATQCGDVRMSHSTCQKKATMKK